MLCRHLWAGAAAFACSALMPVYAHADDVVGTRSPLLVEKSHHIEATLYRGHARWVVRRTVYNGGKRHDQATFGIDVPTGAVATGLRTLGTENGRAHWFEGELLEAEEAARRYQELTGIGGYYPKDPALLSWISQRRLALQVFPCAPLQNKTVEYTFDMPLSYGDGAYHMPLPPIGTHDRLATVVIRAGRSGDRLQIDGKAARTGQHVVLRREELMDVALVPSGAAAVEGELAVVPFAPRKVLTRYNVSVAPRLSSVPARAQVVVVLDTSKSVGAKDRDAYKSAAAAYLSHFPDASVQLLLFDRTPRTAFDRFLPVREATRELEGMTLPANNGSNVDTALSEAERLLAARLGIPASKRIVVLTDGLTRSSLSPGRIRGAIGASGAIVHIGIAHYGYAYVSRDDDHAWSEAVRSSGGLVWRAGANDQADVSDLRNAFESWARPTSIDHIRLVGSGATLGEQIDPPPSTLHEGEGFHSTIIASSSLSRVHIDGEMWARPVQRTLVPSQPAAKRWSALVFGSDRVNELTEPEMMTLARRGGAVSPVTSYLAIEPGVRPSTEGLGRMEQSWAGSAPRVRMGATSLRANYPFVDREAFLQDAIRAAMRSCGLKKRTVSVVVETTLNEVVEVSDVVLSGSADAIGQHCMREAIWQFDLPLGFQDEWTAWNLQVSPPPSKAPPMPASFLRPRP